MPRPQRCRSPYAKRCRHSQRNSHARVARIAGRLRANRRVHAGRHQPGSNHERKRRRPASVDHPRNVAHRHPDRAQQPQPHPRHEHDRGGARPAHLRPARFDRCLGTKAGSRPRRNGADARKRRHQQGRAHAYLSSAQGRALARRRTVHERGRQVYLGRDRQRAPSTHPTRTPSSST